MAESMDSIAAANRTPGLSVRIDLSPDGTESHIPLCDPTVKPCEGQTFQSLDDGIKFYKTYATLVGFDIRLGGHKKAARDGTIIQKRVYCNREGHKNATSDMVDEDGNCVTEKRRRVSKRVGCMARIIFKFCGRGVYTIDRFIEGHNHSLVSECYREFQLNNRNLDDVHRSFILNCARANIGATKSYRLFKEFVGGYSNIGCTMVDFQNFARDLKAYVVGVDAQMILDKLFRRRELCSAFVFDYTVDENDKLTRLFWCDPIERRNFAAFGDVVSFDATYSTNRYNLIFAPFTGKDNHGKCVTFGAGLISKEDVGSYVWLFEKFKDCMGSSPKMIITDQDPAMRIAIERVFIDVIHRFCMWHIMCKVSNKVPLHLKSDSSFNKKLCNAVWSELIEPEEFERQWNDLMVEYDLTDHKWFKKMYALRRNWIPVYFRDHSMSGLFKTTSMSESENGFFGRYARPRSNLVEFFMFFESALDAQRHAHEKLNAADESSVPRLKTPLWFEKHAGAVYTDKTFVRVQIEIVAACFDSRVLCITADDSHRTYSFDDDVGGPFTTVHNKVDDTYTCSCKYFVRFGLLCRHIFVVFKDLRLDTIPEKYVSSRWTKFARSKPIHDIGGDVVYQCAEIENNTLLANQIMSEFYSCLGLVDGDTDKMNAMLCGIIDLKEAFKSGDPALSVVTSRQKTFENFYGAAAPENVTVLPPDPVITKGSCSSVVCRIKSNIEKAAELKKKTPRLCSNCGERTYHDARNCPLSRAGANDAV